MTPPTITIQFDLDSGTHTLMAESYGRVNPAGDRLLHVAKGQPYPDIKYKCDTQEEAEKNAAMLRQHIAGWGKAASKQKVRAAGAE
jgi:hypothetical protein